MHRTKSLKIGLIDRNSHNGWTRAPFNQPGAPIYYAFRKSPDVKMGPQVQQVPHPRNSNAQLHSRLPLSLPQYPDRTLPTPRGPPKSPVSVSSLDLQRWESRYANAASMGTIRLCMPAEEPGPLHIVNPDMPKQYSNDNTFALGPCDQDSVGKCQSLGSDSSSASGEWSDASSLRMTRRVGMLQDGAVPGSASNVW